LIVLPQIKEKRNVGNAEGVQSLKTITGNQPPFPSPVSLHQLILQTILSSMGLVIVMLLRRVPINFLKDQYLFLGDSPVKKEWIKNKEYYVSDDCVRFEWE
jgi:hypothetical protein